MFSGIIEASVQAVHIGERPGVFELQLQRPPDFNDLEIGDSICVNGVCLTLEAQTPQTLSFALAAETLQITQWSPKELAKMSFNLERSLRFGDRLHGHLVSGHVDSLATLVSREERGESLLLEFALEEKVLPYVWEKGSLSINGVSLTINNFTGDKVGFCLVPETLTKTNLGQLQIGDRVNIEGDYMAKAVANWMRQKGEPVWS